MGKTSWMVKDKYNSKAYDEIKIRVKKGRKKEIQEYVKGFTPQLSVNEYINKLIDHDMGFDEKDRSE